MSAPKRVALYARVSTTGQDVDLQLREMRMGCLARNWRIAGEYVDRGVSGRKENRPELDRMLDAARGGELDAVMVWRFDRFGRSVQHLIRSMEELNRLGVAFVSLTESVDTTTAAGRLVFTIFGAMAEFERNVIVERVNAGLRSARARGRVGGRRPVPISAERAFEAVVLAGSIVRGAAALGTSYGTARSLYRKSLREKGLI